MYNKNPNLPTCYIGAYFTYKYLNAVYVHIHSQHTCNKQYLLHESECDMVKYFTSRLIYFHEPKASENKA